MFVTLTSLSDILGLTAEQLQFVPKIILLRECEDYIEHVWNKLPEHIKVDVDVQTYRRCYEHYNQPWQRTHIDGPAPLIKDCALATNESVFCGPGTRLAKRLARGDLGINPLDTACREHDIAYSRSKDLTERHAADKILAKRAREGIFARDSTLGERAASTAV
ncbi:hypothetical protein X777_06962 [Ooceraea biroi]|uniref:Phospholipase A2-like domain-containing protein n=1 Tax=Ooceraea biroi TaxID=2015173 RepID=A0A026WER8_OOCBI|nr:hypothetical protein X777_06962 [Ooceraea biroi]